MIMTHTHHMEDHSLLFSRINSCIVDMIRQKGTLLAKINTPEGKNISELLGNVVDLYYAEKQRLNIDTDRAGAICPILVASGCEPKKEDDIKKEDDDTKDEDGDDDEDVSSTGESEYNFSDIDSEEEDRVTEQFITCGYQLGAERNKKGFVVNKKACYSMSVSAES